MKCPDCHWYVQFLSYSEVYPGNHLNLWEGVCRNRHCPRGMGKHLHDRVVRPSEAIDARPFCTQHAHRPSHNSNEALDDVRQREIRDQRR